MLYSEMAFFDGNHCAHVATYYDQARLEEKKELCIETADRRTRTMLVPIERRIVLVWDRVPQAA